MRTAPRRGAPRANPFQRACGVVRPVLLALLAGWLITSATWAAPRKSAATRSKSDADANPRAEAAPDGKLDPDPAAADYALVDLFDAMKAEQLTADFVARSAKLAKVTLKNQTAATLYVRLPNAFRGVPIASHDDAQDSNASQDQQAPAADSMANAGTTQSLGAGFGPSRAGGSLPSRDGFATLELSPGQQRVFKLACVCLDYGKPDPRPDVPYRLVPLGKELDARLADVLREMAAGDCTQIVAQAGAWHLANGLSWDQLAALRVPRGNRQVTMFSSRELKAARKAVDVGQETAGAVDQGGPAQEP